MFDHDPIMSPGGYGKVHTIARFHASLIISLAFHFPSTLKGIAYLNKTAALSCKFV